ncbi:hypothetical protein ZIOFF_008173 [Zingiber officinale]|uniref:Uncharacterized protein n=1 Tax=Zingiber officinale TaxID=94328 RepID=A0A8J5HYA1_ZINOF|nr:hypothetical protein ZIOFF_008173 [Zingiber officinale]
MAGNALPWNGHDCTANGIGHGIGVAPETQAKLRREIDVIMGCADRTQQTLTWCGCLSCKPCSRRPSAPTRQTRSSPGSTSPQATSTSAMAWSSPREPPPCPMAGAPVDLEEVLKLSMEMKTTRRPLEAVTCLDGTDKLAREA